MKWLRKKYDGDFKSSWKNIVCSLNLLNKELEFSKSLLYSLVNALFPLTIPL